MASRGVDLALLTGSPQALYAPISIKNNVMKVMPTFYGGLMFRAALGGTDSFIYKPVATGTSLTINAWAVYNEKQNVHSVVVVHKDLSAGDQPVTVTVPNASEVVTAKMVVLSAPAIESTSDFDLGNLCFNRWSCSSIYKQCYF